MEPYFSQFLFLLACVNDGSYVVEDRETPRLKALIGAK